MTMQTPHTIRNEGTNYYSKSKNGEKSSE
uniref:Uncharacterized protein n=1 Tax=Rhizophora mucronata TaxID=61149 RepID=A0A2P2NZN4_RHIMU